MGRAIRFSRLNFYRRNLYRLDFYRLKRRCGAGNGGAPRRPRWARRADPLLRTVPLPPAERVLAPREGAGGRQLSDGHDLAVTI